MLERELYGILNDAADAAFVVDRQGLVCSWNPAAEKLFGQLASDVLNRPCAEILEGHSALGTAVCAQECDVLRCTTAHRQVPNFDLKVKGPSGRHVWTNVSILAFRDDRTQRSLTVHLCRDISERKEKEELMQQFLDLARKLTRLPDGRARLAPVSDLTEQERRVLRLLSEGKTPSEVAQELNISPRTFRNHIHHVDQKLHTRNRLEAVLQAVRRGLI